MNQQRVLVIDAEAAVTHVLGEALGACVHLSRSSRADEALALARSMRPSLVWLDARVSGLDAYLVCELIKADPQLTTTSVVFVTDHVDPVFQVGALESGADDVLVRPLNWPVTIARLQAHLRLQARQDALVRDALGDGLTGLAGRSQFMTHLEREWLCGLRRASPLSLLVVDLDGFRAFNDRNGDAQGDACLRHVAAVVQQAAWRPGDVPARLQGDRFGLLLPETPRAGACRVARRIVDGVAAMRLSSPLEPALKALSVRVGVSSFDAESPAWAEPGEAETPWIHPARLRYAARDLLGAAERATEQARERRGERVAVADLPHAGTDALPRSQPVLRKAEATPLIDR